MVNSHNLNEFKKGTLCFKSYPYLTESDLKKVLEFRNDDNVRKWMFDSEMISLATHQLFVQNLRISSQKKYFAIFKNEMIVGCCYATSINTVNQSCDWGFFLNPKFIGSGIGLEIEYYFLEYLFKDLNLINIYGWVHYLNKDSIPMQKLFGFKEIDTDDNFVSLSLSSDDWLKIPNDFKIFRKTILSK